MRRNGSLEILLTPAAAAHLSALGETALTIASLVFSSCCSGPLPPEVKPGAPADPFGFDPFTVDGLTVYFDSLLDPRPRIVIDLKDYGKYQELCIPDWL
jgi:hypothetical protein